ncbi:MAG: GNAT family N-acetyltransferase [Nitrospirota bacterium]|nr:GNAT family N-acetyltransferase [Nitrospirota bacterium]
MNFNLAPITLDDREQIIDIFNHYVENSFAAYPEQKVPYEFFDLLLNMCQGYPTTTVKDKEGRVIGFGMLRPYSPISTFSQTAEITYFLKHGFTGKGIGKTILEYLIAKGKEKGITSILASISSLNDGSINFHVKNGFTECGRFKGIGRKKGKTFDVVYFQRIL